ncbi:GtrA family protein [Exiguobacterium artemiae]|uniref:GtrA family protein n=1 Tax=Exiguobacterium artemiae TaxID=340145 RepID=UPI00047EB9B5|nr:GtrA family protein [Exiguobacterium sibiricum]
MITLFRFLLVGILNTLVGLTITLFCFHVAHTGYWVATAIGNACGVWVSYMLNRRFTFRQEAGGWTYWIRFLIVVLLSYILAYRISLWGVYYFFPHLQETGAILIGMILYTGLNFWGQSNWVFRKSIS